MRAPADDRMEDYLKDDNDMVFKHGMEIAEEIRAAMRSKGRTRYRAPVDGAETSGIDGWIAVASASAVITVAAGQTSRTSHVTAKDENLDYVGLLHEEKYEPNTEGVEDLALHPVHLQHRAGLTSPVRQACRENQMEKEDQEDKDEVYDNNGYRYLPEANAICRRSAKARYRWSPWQLLHGHQHRIPF